MAHERTGIPHVAALDGLRGLAVAAVVLFHAGHLTGGYLGVDLFFVLSGFLITSLLLAESGSSGAVRLGSFWARRARRLLPALAGMLLGVALYCVVFANPDELARIRADALGTVGYIANWRAVFANRDYFALFRSPSPLEHTWSLAIEEQFYLVWPLVFVTLLRLRPNRIARSVLVTAAVGATLAAALVAILFDPANPSRSYFGTDTRAAGILLGATLAAALVLWGPITGRRARRVLEAAGAVGVVVTAFVWTRLSGESSTLYHGGLLIAELAAVAIIAVAVHPQASPLSRALSWRPLCWLGLISYGVYLWHWPVDVVLTPSRAGLSGWPLFLVQCTLTLFIAVISYRFLELPIRRGTGSRRTWMAVTPVVATTLVVVLLVTTISAAKPYPSPAITMNTTAGLRGQARFLDTAMGTKAPRVLLVGDSVAWSLALGAPQTPQAPFAVGLAAMFGCGLIGGTPSPREGGFSVEHDCLRWQTIWRRAIKVFKPVALFLLVGPTDIVDATLRGEKLPIFSPAWRARFRSQLERAEGIATEAHARLVLLSTLCMKPVSPNYQIGKGTSDPSRVEKVNAIYAQFARRHAPRVTYVDIRQEACRDRAGSPQLNGTLLTGDGFHLTVDGSRALWSLITPRLAAAIASPPR